MTSSAPQRTAVRAASTAEFPPPTTTTFPCSCRGPCSSVSLRKSRADSIPFGILARNAQLLAEGGARSQEDRVESLLPQSPQREFPAEPAIAGDFHAETQDHVDVRVELLPGQTVRGNPVPEHPAQAGHRLVDRDRVALQGEVVRAGQARRTAPHDGNPLPRGRQPLRVDARVPGHETLHLVDPDGFVHQVAAARRFALSHAHPSADDGQGFRSRIRRRASR